MKKLVKYLLTNIVNHPQEIKIQEEENDNQISLRVSVHPEDLGQVIGKKGKIIKTIRRLAYILAIKRKKRFNLELLED